VDFTAYALLTNYKTELIVNNSTEKHAVVLCTYDIYGMLERTSPQFYTVRAVNNYGHFQLWKFCSVICSRVTDEVKEV
jgi:hypothetical protein